MRNAKNRVLAFFDFSEKNALDGILTRFEKKTAL
jgi:hypothetical protein